MAKENLNLVETDFNEDLNEDLRSEYDEELHREIVELKSKFGITLQQIANKIKKSPATMSQYFGKKYPGNIGALEELLRNFLQREIGIGKIASATGSFCNTSASTLIWEVLQYCDFKQKMGVVLAPSGYGKTRTCEEYKSKNPSTILITADPSNRTPAQILRLTMKDTGIIRASSIGQMLYDIVDKLKDSNRLIIVDEGHFLTWEAFEILRKIYDYAKVGIVIAGQERVLEQMKGQAQRAYLFDQLYSRIAIKRDKFKVLKKDATAIVNAVCPGLTADCLDFLYSKAQGKGRYRYMINVLDVGMMMHEQYGKDIDIKCLTEAERFLIGE
jgi:hypothetical protein